MKKGHREVPFFILQPDYLAAEASASGAEASAAGAEASAAGAEASAAGAEASTAGAEASTAGAASSFLPQAVTARARRAATRMDLYIVGFPLSIKIHTCSVLALAGCLTNPTIIT